MSKLMYAWCHLTQWDDPDCNSPGGSWTVDLHVQHYLDWRHKPPTIVQSAIVACLSDMWCGLLLNVAYCYFIQVCSKNDTLFYRSWECVKMYVQLYVWWCCLQCREILHIFIWNFLLMIWFCTSTESVLMLYCALTDAKFDCYGLNVVNKSSLVVCKY